MSRSVMVGVSSVVMLSAPRQRAHPDARGAGPFGVTARVERAAVERAFGGGVDDAPGGAGARGGQPVDGAQHLGERAVLTSRSTRFQAPELASMW